MGAKMGAMSGVINFPVVETRRLFGLGCMLCVLLIGSPQLMAKEGSRAAGKVSFVLGKVYISRADESDRVRAKIGSPVFAGDKISTLSGGHAHIRFVDEAMVSVRPNSQLRVDYYTYDPANPAASVIRFDLTEGRVRSISGKGAKANREKFRLNTPIAAIGVRGTDFVVSADQSLVRAIVNEGAIVVAPFSDVCASEGVSRCDTNAVELRGDSQHIIEFSASLAEPRLVPIADKFIPELMEHEPSEVDVSAENAESDSASDSESEGSASDVDSSSESEESKETDEQLGAIIGDMSNISDESDLLKNDPNDPLLIPEVAPEEPKPDNYMPDVAVDIETLNQRSLVWGRWSNGVNGTDRVVARRSDIDGGRSVAVANAEYVLYRSNSELNSIAPGLGVVEFNLVDAQATLTRANSVDEMQVKDGWLNIDFGQKQFSTGVTLKHFLTSEIDVTAQGRIDDNGYFNSRTDTGRLMGASTLDGSEASYYFTQDNEHGVIDGVTYWNGK